MMIVEVAIIAAKRPQLIPIDSFCCSIFIPPLLWFEFWHEQGLVANWPASGSATPPSRLHWQLN